MFESLTAEQITDIRNKTSKIKTTLFPDIKYLYYVDSKIAMIAYRCIVQLREENIEITSDIENAVRVFAALSMTDEEFLELKNKYNSDFEQIAKLYCVNSIYVKCRYKLLLLRRRKLLEKVQQNSNKTNNVQLSKRRVSSKN